MSTLLTFEATDSRDTVYAVLFRYHLSRLGTRPRLSPVPGIDTHSPMPSWVSLITGSAFGSPQEQFQGRWNADGLVGPGGGLYKSRYNASARRYAYAKFTPHRILNSYKFNGRASKKELDRSAPCFPIYSVHVVTPAPESPPSLHKTKFNRLLFTRGSSQM